MQVSVQANGPANEVRAAFADAIAAEKARVPDASAVLDEIGAIVAADLAHVPGDVYVGATASITVHRPDPS